jgi:hypothetical protein
MIDFKHVVYKEIKKKTINYNGIVIFQVALVVIN